MDNGALVAIVIASIGALAGVMPYFRPRRETESEIAKASETLVKPLRGELEAVRGELEAVRKENSDLIEQVRILMKQNAYTEDLEGVRDELQERVLSMQGRIETLERMNKHLIEAFRAYIDNPKDKAKFQVMLDDMEKQL